MKTTGNLLVGNFTVYCWLLYLGIYRVLCAPLFVSLRTFFRTEHEEYHAHPKSFLGTPTWFTLTAYLLIAWGIAAVIGYGITACLLAGFISGYYAYVSCHHIVHHWSIRPNTFLYRYKKFHDTHHYKKCKFWRQLAYLG